VSARVLIGCEFSGTVGAAFLDRGFDVMTCDLRRTERPDVPHYGWHRARTGNASGRGRIRASRQRWLTSGEG
jgi:hypothetical protein